uniref:RdRp n=1 Tax=viral metagenome TaxID=1070528 RepID=A0A2V0RNR6_9ZZZZ
MKTTKLMQESIDRFLSSEGQLRASNGFTTLAVGRPPTPRTPLYKDTPPDQVLENWCKILDQVEVENKILEPLIQYDKSRKAKFGPQGGLRPWNEREEDFKSYYDSPIAAEDYKSGLNEDVILDCRDICFGTQAMQNKRPVTVEKVVSQDIYDDKLNSVSGCYDYAKRDDPSVIARAIYDVANGIWERYPMILGSRSQRGSERFIFIAPFSLNLVEKTFLYPLMERIRSVGDPFFSAWEGFSQVEQGFKDDNFFSEENTYIQQDFTKMDRHVNRKQMHIVAEICAKFWQLSFAQKFSELLQFILDIPVLISLDKLVTGTHGMPSGSGMTNFAESLISLYLILTYSYNGLEVVAFQGLGDDGVIAIRRNGMDDSEIFAVMEAGAKEIGQILNPEKQGISDHTTIYLQRFFDDRIPNQGMVLGMYPSVLALNTAIYPERFHDARKWSKEMEILRWIMILENCKNLPYFRKLIQFFIEGDKYKLGLALPGFFTQLPPLYEESKAIKGFVPTYNQESMDRGIYQFETVKILLEMASQR